MQRKVCKGNQLGRESVWNGGDEDGGIGCHMRMGFEVGIKLKSRKLRKQKERRRR